MELLLARPKPNEKNIRVGSLKTWWPGLIWIATMKLRGRFLCIFTTVSRQRCCPQVPQQAFLSRIKQVSTTTSLLWRTRPAGIILDVYFKVWKLWEMHSLYGSSSKSLTSKLRGWMIKNGRLCGTVGSPIFCDPAQVMLGSTVQKWVPCFFWGGASITQRTKATMFVKKNSNSAIRRHNTPKRQDIVEG